MGVKRAIASYTNVSEFLQALVVKGLNKAVLLRSIFLSRNSSPSFKDWDLDGLDLICNWSALDALGLVNAFCPSISSLVLKFDPYRKQSPVHIVEFLESLALFASLRSLRLEDPLIHLDFGTQHPWVEPVLEPVPKRSGCYFASAAMAWFFTQLAGRVPLEKVEIEDRGADEGSRRRHYPWRMQATYKVHRTATGGPHHREARAV
ncbi:hypothetical protein C8J56DRAFT_211134 [Mycena floridula]|nr:hypothetical protein C8J56DRAFT_211134 [Mycena floridula]